MPGGPWPRAECSTNSIKPFICLAACFQELGWPGRRVTFKPLTCMPGNQGWGQGQAPWVAGKSKDQGGLHWVTRGDRGGIPRPGPWSQLNCRLSVGPWVILDGLDQLFSCKVTGLDYVNGLSIYLPSISAKSNFSQWDWLSQSHFG